MVQTTKVELVKVTRAAEGVLEVQLDKQAFEDGVRVGGGYHRFLIEPGQNPDTILGLVNTHLVSLGFTEPAAAVGANLRSEVATVHTAAVISAYGARRAANDPT